MHSKAERWVQGKNRMAHPDHGTRSCGTIPATGSHPRLGYDTAFPLKLQAGDLQLWISVSQICTKQQPWQAPKPLQVSWSKMEHVKPLHSVRQTAWHRTGHTVTYLQVDLQPVAFLQSIKFALKQTLDLDLENVSRRRKEKYSRKTAKFITGRKEEMIEYNSWENCRLVCLSSWGGTWANLPLITRLKASEVGRSCFFDRLYCSKHLSWKKHC